MTAGQTEIQAEVMGTALGRGRQGKGWILCPPGDEMLGDGRFAGAHHLWGHLDIGWDSWGWSSWTREAAGTHRAHPVPKGLPESWKGTLDKGKDR